MEKVALLERSIEEMAMSGSGLDIEELVSSSTWKEIILKLVETNKLDPWDIDIGKIVVDYMATIRKMRLMDLSVPANILFASAYLLHIKSDSMIVFEDDAESFGEAEEPVTERIRPDIPNLVARSRHLPYRKITLKELMDALEEAVKIEGRREISSRQTEQIRINIDTEDINEKINGTYEKLYSKRGRDGMALFSEVCDGLDTNSVMFDLFIPMLFLEKDGRITLSQEPFFGEIIVKFNAG